MSGVYSEMGPRSTVPLWLLEAGVSGGALRAYIYMDALYADRSTGECWPGRKKLAEDLGVSARSVTDYLTELQELGALRSEERRRKNGGRSTNKYTILSTPPSSGASIPRGTPASRQCEPESVEPESVEVKEDPSLDAQFEDFYNYYPLKRGRGDARRAWNAARAKASQTEIMAGVTSYRFDVKKQRDSGFRELSYQQPGPWLRAERWADEYANTSPPEDPRKTSITRARRQLTEVQREEYQEQNKYPMDRDSSILLGEIEVNDGNHAIPDGP